MSNNSSRQNGEYSGKHRTLETRAGIRNGVKRLIFVLISFLLEIILFIVAFVGLHQYAGWILIITRFAATILILMICSQDRTASIKMFWIMIIMAVPVFGVFLYMMIGLNGYTRWMAKRYRKVDEQLLPLLKEDTKAEERLWEADPSGATLSNYLKKQAGYPLCEGTEVIYYPEAIQGLEAQLSDLSRAERFIFMEYHAIEDAESFHRIEEILESKVKEGVEVRVFYDDMGSIGFITTDFVKRMRKKGIQCRVFNPVFPGLNLFLNNRDHRKITVIDGRIGYTGGYNIANEYFNITHPYGYWKDTGVRLMGPAVKNLTAAFLEMWNAVNIKHKDADHYDQYLPDQESSAESQGFVQPYADGPTVREHVAENVYISIAESAVKYAWFVTPYLIITDEMKHVLCLAAKRGVDVRIITPGIPDKKLVYSVTRSFYSALAANGVRIYEYTHGFCHCKMSVSDDRIATCGTINMDYRSLYHHFENGCVLYQNEAVMDLRKDFEEMYAVSNEVTREYSVGKSRFLRLWQLLLRIMAPLL